MARRLGGHNRKSQPSGGPSQENDIRTAARELVRQYQPGAGGGGGVMRQRLGAGREGGTLTEKKSACVIWGPVLGRSSGCVPEVYAFGAPRQNAQILALCISNTPILGIQKHCCWHIWCRGMRVWGATSKTKSCPCLLKVASARGWRNPLTQ